MNLFFIHSDPIEAARGLCDQHINKMVVETMQMLSTAHHCLKPEAPYLPMIYKPAYQNHPSTIWVRTYAENYTWALQHCMELHAQYTYRWGKVHTGTAIMRWLGRNPVLDLSPTIDICPPQCFGKNGDKYRLTEADANALGMTMTQATVCAYRRYYYHEKKFARWYYTERPVYLDDDSEIYREAFLQERPFTSQ